jgi:hypothetical protein
MWALGKFTSIGDPQTLGGPRPEEKKAQTKNDTGSTTADGDTLVWTDEG